MRQAEESPERYYLVGEPDVGVFEEDCVGITDEEDGDYPIGVAVPEAAFSGANARFYLVVAGRELPGSWTCHGRRFIPAAPSPLA